MDELERLTRDFDPDPERGLAGTIRRARRRGMTRRTSSAVLSLALFGGALGLAWTQFRPTSTAPIAGPSTTPTTMATLPPPSASTYCRGGPPYDSCVTKTGPSVRIASGTREGAHWTLHGFPAVFDGYFLQGPPGSRRFEPVRRSSVCFVWEGTDFHKAICQSGTNFSFTVRGELLMAPADPSLALPNQDPFRYAHKRYGPTLGLDELPGDLTVKWTAPTTERVRIESDGESLETNVVGPFPELRTSWRILIAYVPDEVPARFRAFDENGQLVWEELFPGQGRNA
jgi:hypothetical protein